MLFHFECFFDGYFHNTSFLRTNDAVASAFSKSHNRMIAHACGGFAVTPGRSSAALDVADDGDGGLDAKGFLNLLADFCGMARLRPQPP